MASIPWIRRVSTSNSRGSSVTSSKTTTSDNDDRINMADSKLVQRKERFSSEIATTSDESYGGIKIRKPANIKSKYGTFDEDKRLVQSEVTDSSDLVQFLVSSPSQPNRSSRKKPTNTSTTNTTERFVAVFLLFLLPLIVGITITFSVNVKSDFAAWEIRPEVIHYYKVTLIILFLLWCACEYYVNSNNGPTLNQDFEPMIPGHLLNGLALFGVCNAAFQTLEILDFVKCSRSISGLDKSYFVSSVFEMLFVYVQMYIFYTLSRRRTRKLWFGNYFTMFTLAINLTLWAAYFCAGAVSHPDLKDISWLRHWHYGLNSDLCSKPNNTGNNTRKLHEFTNTLRPYKYTFAMEYSLLASALLLHLWLEMASPKAGAFAATNTKWNVWRFGFVLGLLSLPLLGCVGVYSTVKYSSSNSAFLYSVQLGILAFIFGGSALGLASFRKHYTRVKDAEFAKVDLILLCSSALGFLVLDSFTIVACLFERKNFDHKSYKKDVIMIGIASLAELLTVGILTTFIFASYFYKVRPSVDGVKASKTIRQIASFCITVSFGFWMIRTYTFRSKYFFDYVGWKYFGTGTWFAITEISTPLIIFYHFHCAVCLSEIVADST